MVSCDLGIKLLAGVPLLEPVALLPQEVLAADPVSNGAQMGTSGLSKVPAQASRTETLFWEDTAAP